MKAYKVYCCTVEEGVPVTFKNDPKPHIIIWGDRERRPIEIAVEGWDEKIPPIRLENVEVVQNSEGYVIKPSCSIPLNDNILVFWSWTSPEGGHVVLYTKKTNISIIGESSYSYDGMRIAGLLAVLKKGQYLSAQIENSYGKISNWKLIFNGECIKVKRRYIFGIFKDFTEPL